MTFWIDQGRKLIVYPGHPGALAQYIPEIQPINGRYFALPHTLPNLQLLAWHNWPVPTPMTDQNYDWPIEPGYTPLPHQKLYANFTVLHRRMFNLGDPGTMKTLSTLWAMDFLMRQAELVFEDFRCLIIAPLTILETVWAAGIYRNFFTRRTFEILTGTNEQRIKKLEADVDVYIVNPDGLKVGAHIRRKVNPARPHQKRIELDGFSAALAAREDIKMVIVDEASNFKDHTTARHACATQIFGKRVQHLKQLTGTPATKPIDAYGLAKLSNNAFGKSFTSFRLETMVKVSEFKWVPQKDGYDKAKRILIPAIRFGLDEIWGGPPMTYQTRMVALTDEQKKLMADLKKGLQVIVKSGRAIDAVNEAAARQKFLQISLGAVYDESHNVHTVDAHPRYSEMEEIVESTERKVVIFVPLTSVVHLVDRYLKASWKKSGLDWTCDYINGEVKAKDRTRIIQAFATDPRFKAVICDPQATGHGINEFVAADTVIWLGAIDKTELWIQGNGRIRRPGQKYPSTCFKIVSNKLEEEIFNRLETNTSMQGAMLQAIRNGDF